MKLTAAEKKKQIYYRDARITGAYDSIWQSVGKCVFCDLREKYIVAEENGMVLTVALFAYIDGNVMIVPRRHVRSAKELTRDEWQAARKLMYIAKKLIRTVHDIKGVQYVLRDGGITAQSTVSDHLHIHVVPFDAPDLSVWNYRKLKYTPLENAELYQQHAKKIRQLSEKYDEKYTVLSPDRNEKINIYKNALAQTLAIKTQSKAKNTAQVGASIIAGTTIISRCNASVSNGVMEIEKEDGTWTSPPTVAHAEERCITAAAQAGIGLNKSTMIVTLSPCMACSRLIVNSGIEELHYIHDWWDKEAITFLAKQGVKVTKIASKKQRENQ